MTTQLLRATSRTSDLPEFVIGASRISILSAILSPLRGPFWLFWHWFETWRLRVCRPFKGPRCSGELGQTG